MATFGNFWQLIAAFVAVADFAAAALAVSDGVATDVAVGSPGLSCLRDLLKIDFGPVSSFCIFYPKLSFFFRIPQT